MISLPFSMILISLWEKQIPSFIDIVVSLCLIVNCTFRVLSGQSNSVGILVAFLHSFFTSLQQLVIIESIVVHFFVLAFKVEILFISTGNSLDKKRTEK